MTPRATGTLILGLAMTCTAAAQDEQNQAPPPAAEGAAPPAQPETPPDQGGLDLDTTLRLDPIIVYARGWEELLQDVPQGVTLIGPQTIQDAGITSLREASYLVPNLHMTEFSSRRLSFPTFRGISTGVGDPSVATYIDGVPQLSESSTNISMLDIESIEFDRGPQGTIFGRNSIGGVIQLRTERPSNTPVFKLGGTFGNYELHEYSASYSGPLVEDKLFITLSGAFSSREGYTTNDITGNDVDSRESLFGRVKVLYTPDDETEIEFTSYAEQSRDGGFALGFLPMIRATPHHIAEDFEGDVNRNLWSNALGWRHYGERVDFTSITSFVDWDAAERSDFDFTPFDWVRRFTVEEQQYLYQEFRLASPEDAPIDLGNNRLLRWIGGATFFTSDSLESAATEFRPGNPFGPPGTSTNTGDFDDIGASVFGQGTFVLNERLELTGGARYDYQRKEADITTPFGMSSQRDSYDEITPTVGAAYHLSDDAMVYGRAARGFKAGGFNLTGPVGSETFGTESSWTYEAGVKTTFGDGRFTLNAGVFYIDWNDLQLTLFDFGSGSGYISNAGDATSRGAEIEFAARVSECLDLFGSFGYSDAEFDSFVDQYGMDVSGNHLAFVPETTLSLGAQFHGEFGNGINWFARGEYVGIGTYQLDAGNTESERFGLANFRFGVEWDKVRVEAWIRNAFDDDYVLVAFQPDPTDPSVFVGENGAPQTFGLSVNIRF